jgi:hypothetical protein
LPACALKTADPFLNQGVQFTQARQKTWAGLGYRQDVNILATIETLFKRGGFLEVRKRHTLR